MTERTSSNSSEASIRRIPMKKKAQATHIPLRKKWSSQGWDYVVDNEDDNDGHEFSPVVDPEDQGLLDNLWEDEKKKRAVYHPVASPYIFPTEDEPLRIYGSTYSAMNKDSKKCNTLAHGWNSADDTTPDASDTRVLVEFSPNLENGKHQQTDNTDGQCRRKEDDYVIDINENHHSTREVDQCMHAIANISRKTYNEQIPMNTEISDTNMKTVENTTINEDYNEDNDHENNTDETSHNEKSHQGKNQQQIDRGFCFLILLPHASCMTIL